MTASTQRCSSIVRRSGGFANQKATSLRLGIVRLGRATLDAAWCAMIARTPSRDCLAPCIRAGAIRGRVEKRCGNLLPIGFRGTADAGRPRSVDAVAHVREIRSVEATSELSYDRFQTRVRLRVS